MPAMYAICSGPARICPHSHCAEHPRDGFHGQIEVQWIVEQWDEAIFPVEVACFLVDGDQIDGEDTHLFREFEGCAQGVEEEGFAEPFPAIGEVHSQSAH